VRDWIMLIGGTGLGIVAVTADLVGLGGFPGFGWKQAIATVVALAIIAVSATRIVRRERPRR
jgi:hypothetical protein